MQSPSTPELCTINMITPPSSELYTPIQGMSPDREFAQILDFDYISAPKLQVHQNPEAHKKVAKGNTLATGFENCPSPKSRMAMDVLAQAALAGVFDNLPHHSDEYQLDPEDTEWASILLRHFDSSSPAPELPIFVRTEVNEPTPLVKGRSSSLKPNMTIKIPLRGSFDVDPITPLHQVVHTPLEPPPLHRIQLTSPVDSDWNQPLLSATGYRTEFASPLNEESLVAITTFTKCAISAAEEIDYQAAEGGLNSPMHPEQQPACPVPDSAQTFLAPMPVNVRRLSV